VVAQEVVRHDGCDHKVWMIGSRLYAARRRSQFGGRSHRGEALIPREELPDGVEELARATGTAFGLELFGVDVLVTARGPIVVDINPFPGFRCVPSAGEVLAEHVMSRVGQRKAPA
jgi:ribosomal protein S6--L-glutamate ligase